MTLLDKPKVCVSSQIFYKPTYYILSWNMDGSYKEKCESSQPSLSTKGVLSMKKSGQGFIFRTWRKDPRTGQILYAKDYGLKAWRIPIGSETKSK